MSYRLATILSLLLTLLLSTPTACSTLIPRNLTAPPPPSPFYPHPPPPNPPPPPPIPPAQDQLLQIRTPTQLPRMLPRDPQPARYARQRHLPLHQPQHCVAAAPDRNLRAVPGAGGVGDLGESAEQLDSGEERVGRSLRQVSEIGWGFAEGADGRVDAYGAGWVDQGVASWG